MKRQLLSIFAVCSLATVLVAPLCAQSLGGIGVNIPFEFVAQGKTLLSGQYYLQPVGSSLMIKSADGKTRAFVLTNSVYGQATENQLRLVFHRYADTHFLSQVWSPENRIVGYQLPRTKLEIEMAKGTPGFQKESIVAQGK